MPGDVSPRAKRQQELIDVLSEGEQDEFALSALDFDWRRPLKELADRELVVRTLRAEQAVEKSQPTAFKAAAAPLNAEQREVVDQVVARKKRIFSNPFARCYRQRKNERLFVGNCRNHRRRRSSVGVITGNCNHPAIS